MQTALVPFPTGLTYLNEKLSVLLFNPAERASIPRVEEEDCKKNLGKNYSINNAAIYKRFFSIRCGLFLGILQCKRRFLTFVILPLAGPQTGQVDDILSKLSFWNKTLFRLLF